MRSSILVSTLVVARHRRRRSQRRRMALKKDALSRSEGRNRRGVPAGRRLHRHAAGVLRRGGGQERRGAVRPGRPDLRVDGARAVRPTNSTWAAGRSTISRPCSASAPPAPTRTAASRAVRSGTGSPASPPTARSTRCRTPAISSAVRSRAALVNERAFETARQRIETDEEPALWYFTLADTMVTATPDDKAVPVAKIVEACAAGARRASAARKTPSRRISKCCCRSGKSGWVPVAAARPLVSNRLCYARTPAGEWKIAAFDQNEE